jgi:hypothetical protein
MRDGQGASREFEQGNTDDVTRGQLAHHRQRGNVQRILESDFAGGNPEVSPNPVTILSVVSWFYWDWGYTTANAYPVNLVVDGITLVP